MRQIKPRKIGRSLLALSLLAGWDASAVRGATSPPATSPPIASPAPDSPPANLATVTAGFPATVKIGAAEKPAAAGSQGSFLQLPFRSAARTQWFLETAILRYAYPLGYAVPDGEDRLSCEHKADSGMGRCRAKLTRKDGEKVIYLEIVTAPSLTGGSELHLFGGKEPNCDLDGLKSDFENLLKDLQAAPLGVTGDGILSYQLSNMQADRAVAVLKTFGYPVIEYTKNGVSAAQAAEAAKKNLEKASDIFDISTNSSATPPVGSLLSRPVIIKLIDSEDTSLVQDMDTTTTGGKDAEVSGGQKLSSVTDSAPQQRLLIVYDKNDIESLDILLARLQKYIDVPARQILIEALVVELNNNKLLDLGVDFTASQNGYSTSFKDSFIFTFARPHPRTLLNLTANIKALVENGQAKILSRPSVFVLDGRQAKIKVGDNIPYTTQRTVTDGGAVTVANDFLKTGIILNLRPRAAADNSEVTMQVETIISSPRSTEVLSDGILVAPTVQSRLVQTLVRVANDTPFVIGGLVAQTDQKDTNGIPGLSRIPLLGALFRKENKVKDRREVIIVITPHIVTANDPTLSYSIARDAQGPGADGERNGLRPKERKPAPEAEAELCGKNDLGRSVFEPRIWNAKIEKESIFDSFDAELFRNVYRVRSSDIFDLGFIREDPRVQDYIQEAQEIAKRLTSAQFGRLPRIDPADVEKEVTRRLKKDICGNEEGDCPELPQEQIRNFLTLFDGGIPGEEILVNHMIVRLIERLGFSGFVSVDNAIFFKKGKEAAVSPQELDPLYLTRDGKIRECLEEDKTIAIAFPPDPAVASVEEFEKQCLRPGSTVLSSLDMSRSNPDKILPPLARLVCMPLDSSEYISALRACNLRYKGKWAWQAILLNRTFCGARDRNTMALLQSVLALKRLLELNDSETFPRTLKAFHVGRELVFPTREDLETRKYLLDRRTAQLFYETLDYYEAFTEAYRQIKDLMAPASGKLKGLYDIKSAPRESMPPPVQP